MCLINCKPKCDTYSYLGTKYNVAVMLTSLPQSAWLGISQLLIFGVQLGEQRLMQRMEHAQRTKLKYNLMVLGDK